MLVAPSLRGLRSGPRAASIGAPLRLFLAYCGAVAHQRAGRGHRAGSGPVQGRFRGDWRACRGCGALLTKTREWIYFSHWFGAFFEGEADRRLSAAIGEKIGITDWQEINIK